MTSVVVRRERVLAAAFAAVQAGCPLVTVERNCRTPADAGGLGDDGQPGEPGNCPFLNLIDGGHVAGYGDLGLVSYTVRIDVEGAVVADSDAMVGPAVNDLYGQVMLALMADASLGGECIEIREATFDLRIAPVDESARPFAEFSAGFEIDFHTPDGDPAG